MYHISYECYLEAYFFERLREAGYNGMRNINPTHTCDVNSHLVKTSATHAVDEANVAPTRSELGSK